MSVTNCILGAVRWDWNFATSGANSGNNAFDGEDGIVSPAAYHGLLPLTGTVTGANSVSMPAPTQALMDAEIQMAHRCGIDYFAFDLYPNVVGFPFNGSNLLWTGIHRAFQLYLSSPYKSLVKFCFMLVNTQSGFNPTQANWSPVADLIVSYMQDSQYQTGVLGRKMLYWFDAPGFVTLCGSDANATARANELQSKATAAGVGTLYTGVADVGAIPLSAAAALGVSFFSTYAQALGGTGVEVSQASYDTIQKNRWAAQLETGTGAGVIPCVGMGWDIRSRVANGFWCAQTEIAPYSCSAQDYTPRATPEQIAQRIVDGVALIDANPALCNSRHLLISAWNELSENGNGMLPHVNDGGMNLQTLARVLSRQRENENSLRSRGLPITTR